jgi:hypothetical protein
MESFVFPAFRIFMIMGIAELVLGVLLMAGVLRGRRTGTIGRILGGAFLIAFGIFFLTIRTTGEIRIGEGRMELRIPFGRDKTITTEDIVAVREVDITSDRTYRPVRKISGGNIKNVRTGWYKLANGEKAFLTLEGNRALYVETELGFNALVGAADFERFEAAFIRHVYNREQAP